MECLSLTNLYTSLNPKSISLLCVMMSCLYYGVEFKEFNRPYRSLITHCKDFLVELEEDNIKYNTYSSIISRGGYYSRDVLLRNKSKYSTIRVELLLLSSSLFIEKEK